MSFLLGSVLKLSLATALGGVTVSSPFVFSDTFSSRYPLTTQQLEQFKKSEGFDACYPFLQEDDKLSLLLVCLKKIAKVTYDKTHLASYYFYNGGSWEESISLRKNPYENNSLLVKTKSGWFWNKEREIKNSQDQESNLSSFGLNKECRFDQVTVKGHELNKRIFKCSVGGSELKWKLSEFK